MEGVPRGPQPPPGPSEWRPQPSDEAQAAEDLLTLNGAIEKSYMAQLLQFKASMTPEQVAALRESLPPEFQADLDRLLREVAALDAEDFPPLPQEGDPLETGPYALSPEEREAWELLQKPALPDDFMSYLSGMFPEGTPEPEVRALLDRLPVGVMQELQALFADLQDFERSGDTDPASVTARFQDLSDRMDRLGEQVAEMQGEMEREQQRAEALLQQQQQQQQQQQSKVESVPPAWQQQQQQQPMEAVREAGSFLSGNSTAARPPRGRGRLFGPPQQAWQQPRQPQQAQQRRPMGVS